MNEFDNLLDIVSQLRKDCPWDKEQTHESLAKHLIEESYELLDVLARLDNSKKTFDEFKDELGDLLLQILLHAEIASENNYCLLYTSPSPRDKRQSRMPSSA